ncbi:MAG: hypothetical protein EA353_14695 [Puniceicoccaceae bacterium]|nr:MAG: hypothetical protein EA353_14695 [Puniceicoccaceae bacterium]
MDFFKKNPLFSALVIVCLLVFAAGVYLLVGATRELNEAESQLERVKREADNAHRSNPAPTRENLAAAKANVEALAENLSAIRQRLESGEDLTTTSDPVQLISRIQRHITSYRRMAEDAEERGFRVTTPANFGFGFERYVTESPAIPEQFVERIDLQRQVLGYILEQLFAANPVSITRVQRELIEVTPPTTTGGRPQTGTASATGDRFTMDPALSARVPDAIDTLAFRLTFTGYTDVLRGFLNNLAEFELPIVVRSIEVQRHRRDTTPQRRSSGGGSSLEDIFGPAASTTAPSRSPQTNLGATQRPVIEDNESEYTVILEYIQVTLPEGDSQ